MYICNEKPSNHITLMLNISFDMDLPSSLSPNQLLQSVSVASEHDFCYLRACSCGSEFTLHADILVNKGQIIALRIA